MRFLIVIAIFLILFGCAPGLQIRSVGMDAEVDHICLQYNDRVIVTDADVIIMKLIRENGYTTELYMSTERPDGCDYVMTYTAGRRWMLVNVPMVYAKIDLYRGKDLLGSGTFGDRRRGMPISNRFDGTEANLRPLVKKVLTGTIMVDVNSTLK